MSKRSSPALIGMFVLGALALVTVAVAVFGGSQLFARKGVLVTYFEGSVKGLREGANVVFRGVPLGFVSNIAVLMDVETLTPKIEVTMELLPDSIKVLRQGQTIEGSPDQVLTVEELVEAGFSAKLGLESFVTGQLLVELDFRPARDLELYGTRTGYPEIPSVPSDIQQAIQRFQTMLSELEEHVDLESLGRRAQSVLEGLDELINSKDLRNAIAGIERLVNAADTQRLPASLDQAFAEVAEAARLAAHLVDNVDGDIIAIMNGLTPVAARLDGLIDQARETLEALDRQVSGEAPQMHQLQAALVEVEEAARTLQAFFDYLERHPEALLRGRRP